MHGAPTNTINAARGKQLCSDWLRLQREVEMVRTALLTVRKLCSLRRASAGSSLYGLSDSSQRRCTDAQSTRVHPAVTLLDERISPPPVIQNSNGESIYRHDVGDL
jgi:hypothetical protein